MSLLKRLFCKHSFEFLRNLYGDQIIEWGYQRSVWKCTRCGKLQGRPPLVTATQSPQVQPPSFSPQVDWFAHGMSYALAAALDPSNVGPDHWTTEDVARAFEAGARVAQRIKAASP